MRAWFIRSITWQSIAAVWLLGLWAISYLREILWYSALVAAGCSSASLVLWFVYACCSRGISTVKRQETSGSVQ